MAGRHVVRGGQCGADEISKEELEWKMKYEIHRIDSFEKTWPHSATLRGEEMAAAGFYYSGEADRVTCAFCRGWLQEWSPDDDPMNEHARHHQYCKFIRGADCGNVSVQKLAGPEPRTLIDRSRLDAHPNCPEISGDKPIFKELEIINRRLETFSRWPLRNISVDGLAEAGFYYTLCDDKVRCFHCAVELAEWNLSDRPWIEHARWARKCYYVLQNKGEFFIDQVHEQVNELIEQLKHEAMLKGHSKHDVDEVIFNGGDPFESEAAMRAALNSLDQPEQMLHVVQPLEQPDMEEDAEPVVYPMAEDPIEAVHELREDVNTVLRAQGQQINGFVGMVNSQKQEIHDQRQEIANQQRELENQRWRIERLEQQMNRRNDGANMDT